MIALDGHADVESSAGLRTYLAGLGRVGVQQHSTIAVRAYIIWRAAEELSGERLARLQGLVGKIRAH